MAERLDRIPLIAQREDGIDRAMPLTLFDAESTNEIIKSKKGLILPENSRVVFEVGLVPNSPSTYQGLGSIALNQEIEVFFAGEQSDVHAGMPDKSSMILLKPDSDERREIQAQYDEINEELKPLYPHRNKQGIERRIKLIEANRNDYQQRLKEVDEDLCRDFLPQRQEDLDFFHIDPDEVVYMRLQAAINQKIPKTNPINIRAFGPPNRT